MARRLAGFAVALLVLLLPAVARGDAPAASPSPSPQASPRPTARPRSSPRPRVATPTPTPRPAAPDEGKKPRVFTNDDLSNPEAAEGEKGRKEGEQAAPVEVPASEERSSESDSEVRRLRALQEEWHARGQERRNNIAAAERLITELETKAAALRNDMDPNAGVLEPNRLQRIEAELAKILAELEEARKALADARKDMEDLEEQARKAGVPVGWVR